MKMSNWTAEQDQSWIKIYDVQQELQDQVPYLLMWCLFYITLKLFIAFNFKDLLLL